MYLHRSGCAPLLPGHTLGADSGHCKEDDHGEGDEVDSRFRSGVDEGDDY
jgi:hypothetical protein